MKDVEEIIDDAIEFSNSGVFNAIARLFRRKKGKGRKILREEDFE